MSEEKPQENQGDKLDEMETDDRINFTVYDMPIHLVKDYISIAKLEYDNEVWRVLEHAMDLLKRERNRSSSGDLEERVEQLEAKVGMLQSELQFSDQHMPQGDDDVPSTFGDPSGDNEVAQTIDKIKQMNGD